jgi:hypothetical protein
VTNAPWAPGVHRQWIIRPDMGNLMIPTFHPINPAFPHFPYNVTVEPDGPV